MLIELRTALVFDVNLCVDEITQICQYTVLTFCALVGKRTG